MSHLPRRARPRQDSSGHIVPVILRRRLYRLARASTARHVSAHPSRALEHIGQLAQMLIASLPALQFGKRFRQRLGAQLVIAHHRGYVAIAAAALAVAQERDALPLTSSVTIWIATSLLTCHNLCACAAMASSHSIAPCKALAGLSRAQSTTVVGSINPSSSSRSSNSLAIVIPFLLISGLVPSNRVSSRPCHVGPARARLVVSCHVRPGLVWSCLPRPVQPHDAPPRLVGPAYPRLVAPSQGPTRLPCMAPSHLATTGPACHALPCLV